MTDLSDETRTIGFIGAGNMASALIRGLVQQGLPPKQLLAHDALVDKAQALRDELGVRTADAADTLVDEADVVFIAVKPAGVRSILEGHRTRANGRLWISVAAGVTTGALEDALGGSARVVRAMPNTPALIGQGATGLCGGRHASDTDLDVAERLLGAVGITERVSEAMLDAVTGVSGSGPAFIMLVIESMTDGAVRAGLPRPTALRLAAQTVRGAAALLQETGKHPAELKDMVTSPGGTTISGVEALEAHGLRRAMIAAVTSAAARSRELSGQ